MEEYKALNPLVSIIIPCYNAEATIADAIRSALAQTYTPTEVIVVDDGSTDESLRIIQSFKDGIQWETGPNAGACAARNRGLAMARGTFVQFLDADDILYPHKLALQIPAALAAPDDIVCCDGEASSAGRPEKKRVYQLQPEDDGVVFALLNHIPTPSPLHRRENLVAAGGFDETLPCSQERELHLRLAVEGASFTVLPRPLFLARRRPGSLSHNYLVVLRKHESIFMGARRRLRERGAMTPRRAQAFARALARDARHAFNLGDRALSRTYFKLAGTMHPRGGALGFRHPLLVALARWTTPLTAQRFCCLAVRVRRWGGGAR